MERPIAPLHLVMSGLSVVVQSRMGAGGRPSSSQDQATHRENPTNQEAPTPKDKTFGNSRTINHLPDGT